MSWTAGRTPFVALGLWDRVPDPGALVITLASDDDLRARGGPRRWSWANPTNTALAHAYADVVAVSPAALWQGCKLLPGMTRPEPAVLLGDWRRHWRRRAAGYWAGEGRPPITDPTRAYFRIFLPAYARLVGHWVLTDAQVRGWVEQARRHCGTVYLRGRRHGRDGVPAGADALAVYLGTGVWPQP
jgi:hypothetical protein